MGWKARLQAAYEVLLGQWWARIVLGLWALVCGYDTFSGAFEQIVPGYELRSLGSIAMGGSHLLPWWSWLMVLQAILTMVLLEYLVRHTDRSKGDTATVEADSDQVIGLQARRDELGSELAAAKAKFLAPPPPPSGVRLITPARSALSPPPPLRPRPPEDTRQKIIDSWSRVGSFEVWQAGALWGNELPAANRLFPVSEATRANTAMIVAAAIDGEINPAEVVETPIEAVLGHRMIEDRTRVNRRGLLDFARARVEYPVFLFPNGPQAEDLPIKRQRG